MFMDQIANPKFFPSGRPASPNVLQGHAVYLPTNWEQGRKFPVVFEYLGNTVGVQSLKGIGYGLSGGKDFIWVILPIVSAFPSTQPDVTVNWGNDVALANTVEYAKQAVRGSLARARDRRHRLGREPGQRHARAVRSLRRAVDRAVPRRGRPRHAVRHPSRPATEDAHRRRPAPALPGRAGSRAQCRTACRGEHRRPDDESRRRPA